MSLISRRAMPLVLAPLGRALLPLPACRPTVRLRPSKPQVVQRAFTCGGPPPRNFHSSSVPPHEELFQQVPPTNMPYERSLFSVTSSRKPDCARETGGPDHMNENLLRTLKFIFGCRHRNLSRPFTCSRRTYEVCLDCGRQFPYSLETMSPQRGGPPQDAANAKLPYRIE